MNQNQNPLSHVPSTAEEEYYDDAKRVLKQFFPGDSALDPDTPAPPAPPSLLDAARKIKGLWDRHPEVPVHSDDRWEPSDHMTVRESLESAIAAEEARGNELSNYRNEYAVILDRLKFVASEILKYHVDLPVGFDAAAYEIKNIIRRETDPMVGLVDPDPDRARARMNADAAKMIQRLAELEAENAELRAALENSIDMLDAETGFLVPGFPLKRRGESLERNRAILAKKGEGK